MRQIWAISHLTFREAIRNKILYLLLAFAFFFISASWLVSHLTVGDQLKIIKDMGIGSIHFFGVLITIFIGIGLVFREMEKRTIYLVLSKPVKRYQFLLGKFIGLAFTLGMVVVALTILFYAVLFANGDHSPKLLLAVYLVYLEWLLIAAIAILFSSFSTPLLSAMLTLACFLAGHLSESLLMLRSRLASELANGFITVVFYFLPNLELFNIRSQMVHNLPIEGLFFASTTIYWLGYVSALLLGAIAIFQKKDFV